MTEQNGNSEEQKAELSNQNAALKKQKEELSQQIEKLTHQNAELSRQNTELERQNAELNRQNAELKSRDAGLENRNAELKSMNAVFKPNIAPSASIKEVIKGKNEVTISPVNEIGANAKSPVTPQSVGKRLERLERLLTDDVLRKMGMKIGLDHRQEQVILILHALFEQTLLSLKELSERTEIPEDTLMRLIRKLTTMGWMRRVGGQKFGGYRLTEEGKRLFAA